MSTSSSSVSRMHPLPSLSWAEPREVWNLMLSKDEQYTRNPLLISRHPTLQAKMRSILLDWLSEVCEVYKLHRETFYLALDFIDRYLSNQTEIPKSRLQLIGITSLFIASKIEEIYPPKLSEFAYVTDGACSEDDIISQELVILKSLNWQLTPMTVNNWLSVYMQLFALLEKENKVKTRSVTDLLMSPSYSTELFSKVAHLLDLSMLDINCLQYSYSVIAAAALYHFTSEDAIDLCCGLKLADIKECVIWMTPFALAIRDEGFDNPKLQKAADFTVSLSTIQAHTADLSLLEKAHLKQQNQDYLFLPDDTQSERTHLDFTTDLSDGSSTMNETSSPGKLIALLTPPRSSSKPPQGSGDGTKFRKTDKRRWSEQLWNTEPTTQGRKHPRKKSPMLA